MNANVSRLLNEQINKEFYSAYLYLDFANYYAAVGLDGFETVPYTNLTLPPTLRVYRRMFAGPSAHQLTRIE